MSVEEGHSHHETGLKHWLKRHKILVTVLGVGLGVLICIGIILGIVFSVIDKNDPNNTTNTPFTTRPVIPSDPNSRVDCLPWLKLKNNTDELLRECMKYDYCSYHSVDNNKQVPSCYYEKNKITYQVISNQPTDWGFAVTIQRRNSESQYKNLKIDFEFLDDNTLRFKVK